jgi:hypothetical protein
LTGKRIDLLAWPYGESSEDLERLSEDAGYRAAWSGWKGRNSKHSLCRVKISRNDNLPRFVAKASGAYFLSKFLENKVEKFKARRKRTISRKAGEQPA